MHEFFKGIASLSSALNQDKKLADSAETIYISPLSLLKMLKHCRAGVPMEVIGLMLGEFVDEYTIIVKDVFAMPQSGTTVSVESIDPVFQTNMLEMLKQINRTEMVIGWYHSHPGFGCWLSNVDANTQQSFESLNSRAVAVVVDPIQSVKGKVVIDAFRNINMNPTLIGSDVRSHTSTEGFLNPPTISALIHGLNKSYYSINIKCTSTMLQNNIMLSLYEEQRDGLVLQSYKRLQEKNDAGLKKILDYLKKLTSDMDNEKGKSRKEIDLMRVGIVDPKTRLKSLIEELTRDNVRQSLTSLYCTEIF